MLAFKPEFIRTLWYTLLTTKTPKNHLAIGILSRGLQICEKIFIDFFGFSSDFFVFQLHLKAPL
jgi:hypothetical protein